MVASAKLAQAAVAPADDTVNTDATGYRRAPSLATADEVGPAYGCVINMAMQQQEAAADHSPIHYE